MGTRHLIFFRVLLVYTSPIIIKGEKEMQVILKKEVQNIGEAGDLVNVKDGYARNFLIPKNYAEVATEGALKNREQNLARLQAKQEKLHQEALAKAEQIEKLGSIELSAKAGESGKLFGTITTKKLCEELKEKAGIEVDRKTVSQNAPINRIGEFTMLIKLTSKVKTELKVVVTASEVVKEHVEETEEAEAQLIFLNESVPAIYFSARFRNP